VSTFAISVILIHPSPIHVGLEAKWANALLFASLSSPSHMMVQTAKDMIASGYKILA